MVKKVVTKKLKDSKENSKNSTPSSNFLNLREASLIAYIFGILSITFSGVGFFLSFMFLPGILFSIIGLAFVRGGASSLSLRAKKLNLIGLFLGIFGIVLIGLLLYFVPSLSNLFS